jgi:hypothetical protein
VTLHLLEKNHRGMTSTHPQETNLGVITTWLPMITVAPGFVPSQMCSIPFYLAPQDVAGQDVYDALAFDPWYGRFINTSIQCLSDAATVYHWENRLFNDYRARPLRIPFSVSTVVTSALDNETTFVGCCPESITYPERLNRERKLTPLTIALSEMNSSLNKA